MIYSDNKYKTNGIIYTSIHNVNTITPIFFTINTGLLLLKLSSYIRNIIEK